MRVLPLINVIPLMIAAKGIFVLLPQKERICSEPSLENENCLEEECNKGLYCDINDKTYKKLPKTG